MSLSSLKGHHYEVPKIFEELIWMTRYLNDAGSVFKLFRQGFTLLSEIR